MVRFFAAALAVLVVPFRPAWAQSPPPGAIAALQAAVREQHPAIAARRAAITAAESRVAGAASAPPLLLSAEIEEVPDGLDLSRAGSTRLDLSREFVPGRVRTVQRAIAGFGVERERLRLDALRHLLAVRVEHQLAVAAFAEAIARRHAATDTLLADIEITLRSRFAAAEASYAEVLRLRTEQLRLRGDRAAALREARAARTALRQLLPAAPAGDILVDAAIAERVAQLDGPLADPADDETLMALQGGLALAAVDVAEAAMTRDLRRAEAGTRITASAGMQRFAGENGRFAIGPVLGIGVTLPWTARRATDAALALAEREYEMAHARHAALTASLRGGLRVARERYQGALAQRVLFDDTQFRGAADERENAVVAYRNGQLSLLQLLDFERALADAEVQRLHAGRDLADALAALLTGTAADDLLPEDTGR